MHLRRLDILAIAALLLGFVPRLTAEVQTLDDGSAPERWKVVATEGVVASLVPADGPDGPALRLDFDFQGGAGFCIVRRELVLPLPENYRFTLQLRGVAPPNNFEFKLIDRAGENVWWVNRRMFEFPTQWQTLTYRRRHFQFAWGPSGGKPLEELSAIELAIAAGSGGKGSVWLDTLTFESLPPTRPPAGPPVVHASSAAAGERVRPLGEDGELNWHSAPDDAAPTLDLDLGGQRELGGLIIAWDADDFGTGYDVAVSNDGQTWTTAATVRGSIGGLDPVVLPEAEAAHVRVAIRTTSRGQGVGIRAVHVQEAAFGESRNALFRSLARRAPRGHYPRYFLGEQTPWTVVGVAGDKNEALLSSDGALEIAKGGPSLEPFVWVWRPGGNGSAGVGSAADGSAGATPSSGGKLVTWADVTLRHGLADGYLPIPSVTWTAGPLELEITALADGAPGESFVLVRYRLVNRGAERLAGRLAVALRPFQVLPPWQELNLTGGAARVEAVAIDGETMIVDGRPAVRAWARPENGAAAVFAQGEIIEHVAAGETRPAADSDARAARDDLRLASGVLAFAFDLAPGDERPIVVMVPLHPVSAGALPALPADPAADFAKRLARVSDDWRRELNRVTLRLPPAAAELANTFRTVQGHILINADGPAIQPGSRTYERSWIRDGALTSTALLATGHPEQVTRFLDWYAPYQFPGGKVPCVVDARGADPVPEHDSTGQLIYALAEYYRFTGDRELLERHLPRVIAGVDYIESLRAQRMTDEYREGPSEKRACYGLVPESISHEGYSAKPMHSYWDSFFTLRGLRDAAYIAGVLERRELAERFARLHDEYAAAVAASVRLAIELHKLEYVPGCVELGDFDATSTAIAVFPCAVNGYATGFQASQEPAASPFPEILPAAALTGTFDRYLRFFRDRREGRLEWKDYTPYELRIISTLVHLDQPDAAHELLAFFLRDRRPAGWNQWAEVVWRDPAAPRFIGDMPHTWCGSEFVNAVRNLFVYEREQDAALVLAAGVPASWREDPAGVALGDFPTEYGPVSYTLRTARRAAETGRPDETTLALSGPPRWPSGGCILKLPGARPIRAVQADGGALDTFSAREVHLANPVREVRITHAAE